MKLENIKIPIKVCDLSEFSVDFDTEIFALSHHLHDAGIISNAKGYIASINSDCDNHTVVDSLRRKVTDDFVYVNVGHLSNFLKYRCSMLRHRDGDLATIFDRFFGIGWSFHTSVDVDNVNDRLDQFFKFVPQFSHGYFNDRYIGYCCFDCDGNYDDYVQMKLYLFLIRVRDNFLKVVRN